MFSWEAWVVGTIFSEGYTRSACFVSKGTPRLWNTFRPASITLDTKSVVEIIYAISVTSATKLKKYKVQTVLMYRQILKQKILYSP